MFAGIINNIIEAIMSVITNILSISMYTLEEPFIQQGIRYSQTLAFALLAIKVTMEGINQYMLHESGDSSADPTGLLVRTAQAIVVITFLPDIIKYIFNFGNSIFRDISSFNAISSSDYSNSLLNTLTTLKNIISGDIGWAILIIIVTTLIMIIVVAIQSLIRGAELGLMAVIGPMLALNLTANNKQIWDQWLKQVILICVSQAVQLFIFAAALSSLATVSVGDIFFIQFFKFAAWGWVAIKTPKLLKEFTYSTGMGAAAGGVGRTAASSFMMQAFAKGMK